MWLSNAWKCNWGKKKRNHELGSVGLFHGQGHVLQRAEVVDGVDVALNLSGRQQLVVDVGRVRAVQTALGRQLLLLLKCVAQRLPKSENIVKQIDLLRRYFLKSSF